MEANKNNKIQFDSIKYNEKYLKTKQYKKTRYNTAQ